MQRSGATTWLDSATPPPPPRPLITRPSKTHPPFQPRCVVPRAITATQQHSIAVHNAQFSEFNPFSHPSADPFCMSLGGENAQVAADQAWRAQGLLSRCAGRDEVSGQSIWSVARTHTP